MNNKGVMWSDVKNAVLTALIIGLGVYIIWAYILHGGLGAVGSLQKCNALTGNNGLCKQECDPAAEFAFEGQGLGCTGKANLCCVRKNQNMNDAILPDGYGGNDQYEFEVTAIDFGTPLPPKCVFDTKDPLQNQRTIICEPGYAHNVPVDITVKNLHNAVKVYADPIVVINGNGDKMSAFGKYKGKIVLDLAKNNAAVPGEEQTYIVNTFIPITSNQYIQNDYWEIYPYAKCDTKECMATDDPAHRGILNTKKDTFITISFESKTT